MTPTAQHSTSTLSPVQEKVALALASGSTITAAAADAGLHRVTVYRWSKTNPAFCDAVEHSRAEFILARRDDLHYLGNRAMETLLSLLDNPRTPPGVLLRTSIFILTRSQDPARSWCLPESLPESNENLQLELDLLEKEAGHTAVDEPAGCNEMQHENESVATLPETAESPYSEGGLPSCPVPESVQKARDSHAYYLNALDDLKTTEVPESFEDFVAAATCNEMQPENEEPVHELSTCPVPGRVREARSYRKSILNILEPLKRNDSVA